MVLTWEGAWGGVQGGKWKEMWRGSDPAVRSHCNAEGVVSIAVLENAGSSCSTVLCWNCTEYQGVQDCVWSLLTGTSIAVCFVQISVEPGSLP